MSLSREMLRTPPVKNVLVRSIKELGAAMSMDGGEQAASRILPGGPNVIEVNFVSPGEAILEMTDGTTVVRKIPCPTPTARKSKEKTSQTETATPPAGTSRHSGSRSRGKTGRYDRKANVSRPTDAS